MSDGVSIETDLLEEQINRGIEAAKIAWQASPGIEAFLDDSSEAFANAFLDELVIGFESTPGIMKEVVRGGAANAENLNVSPFQGLVEVIQNADDVRATEVRFAIRAQNSRKQLILVHNGHRLRCKDVLGMTLPFITTKRDEAEQRGRFGIGLKTLKRIANTISIHSAPYHFNIIDTTIEREKSIENMPDFYDSSCDTLICIDLKENFEEAKLKEWFDSWEDDGLLFLASVSSFKWCEVYGTTISAKKLDFTEWMDSEFNIQGNNLKSIKYRTAKSHRGLWTIWKTKVVVPDHLNPSHKTRTEFTEISIALPDCALQGSLYIGFKTLINVGYPYSIDAQFDPSTARENLVSNEWNEWLIERSGEVIAALANNTFLTDPAKAWYLIPLIEEEIGNTKDQWLQSKFNASSETLRNLVKQSTTLHIGEHDLQFSDISYEEECLTELLETNDINLLTPEHQALPLSSRDARGRWRLVLDDLDISKVVGIQDLISGFNSSVFGQKSIDWWLSAGHQIITSYNSIRHSISVPFLLSDTNKPISWSSPQNSNVPLMGGKDHSAFSDKWGLLDHLSPAYGESEIGNAIIEWLTKHTLFQNHADPLTELTAFAVKYADSPILINDEDLREIRDMFDQIDQDHATQLGLELGKSLLLDGFVFKAGKKIQQSVSPTSAYLSKTLDGEFPYWPVAAGKTEEIKWISPRYDLLLKTGAIAGQRRRRENGLVSRGARRFLTLIGAESSPRIIKIAGSYAMNIKRHQELRAVDADAFVHDFSAPDIEKVINTFKKLKKVDLKISSPALLKTLARNWERMYQKSISAQTSKTYRGKETPRSGVPSTFLRVLERSEWIAIGKGNLVAPSNAVIKSPETQTMYGASQMAIGIAMADLNANINSALKLIIGVRVSELVTLLKSIRNSSAPMDEALIMQIYKDIAKKCSDLNRWDASVGNMTGYQLRAAFAEGLIYNGYWHSPSVLFHGEDIFHQPYRFVPKNPQLEKLWVILDVPKPDLKNCIDFCKQFSEAESVNNTAALIDTYRYMEALLEDVERKHREKLKALPLNCSGKWITTRPVYYIENEELRREYSRVISDQHFWDPPCEMRDLPKLLRLTGVITLDPKLEVEESLEEPYQRGESLQLRFSKSVELLSDELAKRDPETRNKISVTWDELKGSRLYIYDRPFRVKAFDEKISSKKIDVYLQSFIHQNPLSLHVSKYSIDSRNAAGQSIASLFPIESRRSISAEWVVAWISSINTNPEGLRMAADEAHNLKVLEEQAEKINVGSIGKIKLSKTKPNNPTIQKPRLLRTTIGALIGATVTPGTSSKPPKNSGPRGILPTPPTPSGPSVNTISQGPMLYTTAQLEEKGWEILSHVLSTSPDIRLQDFRNKRGVGADGVIDWKTFVELKATGRGPSTSIDLTNNEYLRAKERGADFMLVLISGLEEGEKCEVRIIVDPYGTLKPTPVNGMRVLGLLEAPAIVLQFEDEISQNGL